MKKRILFVDDEPNVLQGLRRMMRSMRQEWDMQFANDGTEALEILFSDHFDVVVADMRIPGMDGAELLDEIKKRHPQVVRFILSGSSDKELVMKSVGQTHQFLSKPCDSEQLKNILVRAFALRDVLNNNELKTLVSSLKSLPSLPSVYFEIMEAMKAPDFTMKMVGEIISKDVGMTAKMLQMVNSSFFGVGVRVTDPIHAARLLGPEILKALVISVQIFSKFNKADSCGLSLEKFSNHCMAVASLAKEIAKHENQDKNLTDGALIAGMLHDAGKLILAENLPERYKHALSIAKSEYISAIEAEEKTFAATHAEVGAYLLGIWGLPDPIVETLAFHHHPSKSLQQEFTCLTAVHVANALVNDDKDKCTEMDSVEIDHVYLSHLGLDDKLADWRELYEENKRKRSES